VDMICVCVASRSESFTPIQAMIDVTHPVVAVVDGAVRCVITVCGVLHLARDHLFKSVFFKEIEAYPCARTAPSPATSPTPGT